MKTIKSTYCILLFLLVAITISCKKNHDNGGGGSTGGSDLYLAGFQTSLALSQLPVSYTHLDVYKRQEVAILMLTVFEDNKNVFDAICAGASGYLLKKNVSDKLIPFIHDVLSGGAPMSPAIAKIVISSMQQMPNSDYQFNDREKEILVLLCKGNSYKMIAAQTGLAFETIRSYIKKIYEKLQVHSATEAVSKAINEKLV